MSTAPGAAAEHKTEEALGYSGNLDFAAKVTGSDLYNAIPSLENIMAIREINSLEALAKEGKLSDMAAKWWQKDSYYLKKGFELTQNPRIAAHYGQGLNATLQLAKIAKERHTQDMLSELIGSQLNAEEKKAMSEGKAFTFRTATPP